MPSFTFVATLNAIVNAGAEPVFVDIEKDTLNMSVNAAREKMDDQLRAIMVVPLALNNDCSEKMV